MKRRIFRSMLTVAGVVMITSLVIVMGVVYGYFGSMSEKQLADELNLAALGVENGGEAYLAEFRQAGFRLTWIDRDGTVKFDTKHDGAMMENHADREEVIEAFETGEGESSRYSKTLLEKMMYRATRLSDGSVLRISLSRAAIWTLVMSMSQPILMVAVITLVLSSILAGRLSKRIVRPMNELDLENPLENSEYEELAPLLNRMERQRRKIESQMDQIRQKTAEFEQTIGNMAEALVLLDENGQVMSINKSALELFETGEECIGKDFVTVDRDRDLISALDKAAKSEHSELQLRRRGSIYQVNISRIMSDGDLKGVVIIAFDITEKSIAEMSRREFTANVSHELKTPLQSIIGSAELIDNGLVKPEDMPKFVGNISSEAKRLVNLIDDIINLSQIDEGAELVKEDVNLLDVACDVVSSLEDVANSKKISITADGDESIVKGVKRLVTESIFNLCDNAIKYNKEGGAVKIRVEDGINDAAVSVSDDGIGIPYEDQERVFERFYRVDKSHSRASGGTGLGLSIVKHAVQYHHGNIELKSLPGKGTVIRMSFPKEANQK